MIIQNYDTTAFVYALKIIILAKIIGDQHSKLEKLKQSLGQETYDWILGIPQINFNKEYLNISEFIFKTN